MDKTKAFYSWKLAPSLAHGRMLAGTGHEINPSHGGVTVLSLPVASDCGDTSVPLSPLVQLPQLPIEQRVQNQPQCSRRWYQNCSRALKGFHLSIPREDTWGQHRTWMRTMGCSSLCLRRRCPRSTILPQIPSLGRELWACWDGHRARLGFGNGSCSGCVPTEAIDSPGLSE